MTLSDPFPFTYQGRPAEMRVCRNNGYCWGQISCGGTVFEIETRVDHYERTDEDAAQAFIRTAQRIRPSRQKPE